MTWASRSAHVLINLGGLDSVFDHRHFTTMLQHADIKPGRIHQRTLTVPTTADQAAVEHLVSGTGRTVLRRGDSCWEVFEPSNIT